MFEKDVTVILEEEERGKILRRLQANAEEEGLIPLTPSLFATRYARLLQRIGGCLLGCFLGICALLFNYALFVLFLHAELNLLRF